MGKKRVKKKSISFAMILIAIGIVYGDIATSPMYVMKSIVSGNGGINNVDKEFIIGSLSLVIWTITLLTTVKHVLIAMRADNKGEGGIFALYSLVKNCAKWLIVPAMIGGSALLADSILTPAVTVTTAVEGLRSISVIDMLLGTQQTTILVIVTLILSVLFFVQKAGTSIIGKAFGPFMTIWFLFLAIMGINQIAGDLEVLRAFNPLYALKVLISPENKLGLMILGSVFLATTGAEALYSDMGHVGKKSIYISWPFVKLCLILNYLGQGAWIIKNSINTSLADIPDLNPFYLMMSPEIRVFGIILGAMAAIIASQALITGSFTIVSEAIKLDLLPHMKTYYPSETKGQLYIPLVNNLLWVCCLAVVFFFRTSARMESAYGLAITITLLMVTILLIAYIGVLHKHKFLAILFALVFGFIEIVFFVSCAAKFVKGGYVAIFIALIIFLIMNCWNTGTRVERMQISRLKLTDYIPKLEKLKNDKYINKTADNIVFLTHSRYKNFLEYDILYSILDKQPKKANAYYFVNITLTSKPYGGTYSIENFGTNFIFRVTIRLGFKEDQRLNVFMNQIFNDLLTTGELIPQVPVHSVLSKATQHKLKKYMPINLGSVKYCLIHKTLIPESDLTNFQKWAVEWKYRIRSYAGSPARWYGLENSSLIIEHVPLFISNKKLDTPLKRVN